jgi:hypothetical protein
MNDPGGVAGAVVVWLAFGALALIFYRASRRAKLRSARLANLSLCVGIAGFVAFQLTSARESASPGPSEIAIVIRTLLGLGTVVLAVTAFVHRRRDGGGIVRPIIGGAVGLTLLAAAAASILFASFTSTSGAWTYQSPDNDYRLALPSGCWREGVMRGKQSKVMFACSKPRMQAVVMLVKSDQSESDFVSVVARAREFMESKPGRRATSHRGVNASGNSYHYLTTIDAGAEAESDRVFVADCYTWKPSKRLLVQILFEAPMTLLSIEGKEAAAKAIAASADTICKGVD